MKINPTILKKRIRFFPALLGAATASLLLIGSSAQAGYIVTLEQIGFNVVATGSGAIDLTNLSFDSGAGGSAGMTPNGGSIETGPTTASVSLYTGFSGPTSFGSGSSTNANSGSGDFVGILDSFGALVVPQGYVSGTALSDSSTYDNTTLSKLGVTPGTYEWTWGTGAHADSFTLNIVAHVPDQGSSLTLLSIVLLCWLGFDLARRRVMKV